jgi:hypothetical protein
MYADDITMFLRDKEDLENVLKLLTIYTSISNLNINKNKTEAMWLGAYKNTKEIFCNLKWKNQIKILGIIFRNDTPASQIDDNWLKRIEKVERIISLWTKRNLSISGKLCIIKSFLLSQFVYPLQALSAPTAILQRVNTMLFRFLWKRKYTNTRAYEKVKRNVLCNIKEEGGLNMINIIDMQHSFMLNWISQLNNDAESKWKIIPTFYLNKVSTNLTCFNANGNAKDVLGLEKIKLCFWKKSFTRWVDFMNKYSPSPKDFNNFCLWNNKNILYRNKCLLLSKWTTANLNFVHQVWIDGDLLPFNRIMELVGDYPALMLDYNALHTALHALHLRHNNAPNSNVNSECLDLHSVKAWTPKSFRLLLTKEKATQPCSEHFWLHKYNVKLGKEHWIMANNCSLEERLRLLQWKILHNIYPTNILLSKMKIRDHNRCSFCGEVDYIEHFFFKCSHLKVFWKIVENKIFFITGLLVQLNETDVMFGYQVYKQNDRNINMVNLILLIAKMAVSIYKYGNRIDLCYIFDTEITLRFKAD